MGVDKFRAIMDSSPMGASVYSVTRGARIFTNQRAVELFGAPSEAAFNALPAEQTFFDPEQARVVSQSFESFVNTPREEIRRRVDGSLWISSTTRQRLMIGKEDIYLIWFEDVTEREAAAERLRRMFNIPTIPMAFYYAKDKSWIEFNDSFRELFGYDRDELAGMTWVDLTHPEDLEMNLTAFAEAIGNKSKTSYTLTKRFIRKNGEVIHTRIHTEHIRSIDDKPEYVILVVHDITDDVRKEALLEDRRVELERTVEGLQKTQETLLNTTRELGRLVESEARLRETADAANATKSRFLATVSHEIRTPMTGIMGFADMLLDEDLPETAHDMVARIKYSASSLLTVINDVLDISKLDADKLETENVNFNPAVLINDVMAFIFSSRLPDEQARVRAEVQIDEGFPEAVSADPTRLRQILVNLVGNAKKFTENGAVILKCGLGDAPSTMKFEVVDTGIGIDTETQQNLFDDFVQADSSISRKYHGTGLGLAICRRLVDLMGGDIGVESAPGKGSTFWFTLPYVPVADVVLFGDPLVHMPRNYKATKPLHVLVVEDNEINQMIIGNILGKIGYDYIIAGNGIEAVDAVKAADFDIILMDVRMPELSGPEATRQIRGLGGKKGDVPIIALTADAMTENRQSYFDAGMNDFVSKPIDIVQLASAINNALGETVNVPVDEVRQAAI